MPNEVVINVGWAIVFSLVGGTVGIMLVFAAAVLLPRVFDRFTPDLDEGKEIARGNVAVAQYFGRVVGATIIAAGIVIAAAILGGFMSALH